MYMVYLFRSTSFFSDGRLCTTTVLLRDLSRYSDVKSFRVYSSSAQIDNRKSLLFSLEGCRFVRFLLHLSPTSPPAQQTCPYPHLFQPLPTSFPAPQKYPHAGHPRRYHQALPGGGSDTLRLIGGRNPRDGAKLDTRQWRSPYVSRSGWWWRYRRRAHALSAGLHGRPR